MKIGCVLRQNDNNDLFVVVDTIKTKVWPELTYRFVVLSPNSETCIFNVSRMNVDESDIRAKGFKAVGYINPEFVKQLYFDLSIEKITNELFNVVYMSFDSIEKSIDTTKFQRSPFRSILKEALIEYVMGSNLVDSWESRLP